MKQQKQANKQQLPNNKWNYDVTSKELLIQDKKLKAAQSSQQQETNMSSC
jgi:hypothetical protein